MSDPASFGSTPVVWPSRTPIVLVALPGQGAKGRFKKEVVLYAATRPHDRMEALRLPRSDPRTHLHVTDHDPDTRSVRFSLSSGDDGPWMVSPKGHSIGYTRNEKLRRETEFVYVPMGVTDDGRPTVALRASNGKFLAVNPKATGTLPGSPVIAFIATAPAVDNGALLFAVEEPVHERHITHLTYREAEESREAVPPAVDYRTMVVNPSDGPVTKTFTFTHEKETVGTWNNSVGRSISVGAKITAGLPKLGGGVEMSVDVTASQERSWGGSKGEAQTVEDTTTIVVPEQTSMTVRIVVGRSRVTIPFTYTVERVDLTGHAMPPVTDENGVYQQVETLGTDVQVTSSPIAVASPTDPPGRPTQSSGT